MSSGYMLKTGEMVNLLKGIYVLSFNKHYSNGSNLTVNSVQSSDGIPLLLSKDPGLKKKIGNILKLDDDSGFILKIPEENKRKIILDDYKYSVHYSSLGLLLSGLNHYDKDSPEDSPLFNSLDIAFNREYIKNRISGNQDEKKDLNYILSEFRHIAKSQLQDECVDIYGDLLCNINECTLNFLDRCSDLLDIPDDACDIRLYSKNNERKDKLIGSLKYFGPERYEVTFILEEKDVSEIDLLLAYGLIIKYMDHFDISLSQNNQERILRYIKNANFLKSNVDYINEKINSRPIPTSSVQQQVPVLI